MAKKKVNLDYFILLIGTSFSSLPFSHTTHPICQQILSSQPSKCIQFMIIFITDPATVLLVSPSCLVYCINLQTSLLLPFLPFSILSTQQSGICFWNVCPFIILFKTTTAFHHSQSERLSLQGPIRACLIWPLLPLCSHTYSDTFSVRTPLVILSKISFADSVI